MTRFPDSSYATKYPFSQVSVSRSGHEFHVDDTPGATRIRQAHKSGSFFEISEDGRKVELIVADEYKYTKGGLTLTVDGNGDVMIGGNLKIVVQGDLYAEVQGDLSTVVKGDSTVATLGDSVVMTDGDSLTKVNGTMSAKVDGNINITSGGDVEIDVSGDASIVSDGEVTVDASKVSISCDVDIDGKLTVSGDVIGNGTSLHSHVHKLVKAGTDQSGPPA